MREFLNKFIALIYMIVILVMVWLPIYCYLSNATIPGVVSRHIIASNLIWYGATAIISCIPAMHLKKGKYVSWAISIGFTLIIIGLILCTKNI